jgi:predicted nucleic acid-binding protein
MNARAARTFVDTDVLVYLHDLDTPAKQKAAAKLLDELWREQTGVLSVQVLQEFYVTVTRKIGKPLTKDAAREIVNTYAAWCGETSAAEVAAAFRIEVESRIGFWDALIVASAAKAGAVRIVSEDMNAGQVIAGVRIQNPFAHLA